MRSIALAIQDKAAEKLAELARRQYRVLRQLAALMFLEAIERAAKTPTAWATSERREAVSQ